MDKPEFVYTTYINTTAEQLWQALTEPEHTSRYWGATFESDWQPGSEMSWTENGLKTSDPGQVVLEAEPHHRLSYTWHTFTPEFGEVNGMNAEVIAAMAEEPRSKVTFDAVPHGKVVKLTVTHDGFGPESTVLAGVSEGWPEILSSLKSLLETGEAL
jgi:uncharacterized protein YndB with AHSA1/START domain